MKPTKSSRVFAAWLDFCSELTGFRLFGIGCIAYMVSAAISFIFEVPTATVFAYILVLPLIMLGCVALGMFALAIIVKILR